MPKRIGKSILRNACVWMPAVVLVVPALEWIGSWMGRELVLYAPQYEHIIRAAVMTALAVSACFGRREVSRAGRVCSMVVLPLIALLNIFLAIGSMYLDGNIRPMQGLDSLLVLLECVAAAVAYVACSGQKIGHALEGLGIGLLLPIGLLIALLWSWMWLILGIGLIVCLVQMRWKCLIGMLSGCMIAVLAVLSLYGSISMREYCVDVSEEVASPDGTKKAQIVHLKNLIECSQQLKIYESGKGIWVGIGYLRKTESINLDGEYVHVYDEEAQEFLPLSWQDNDTVLLDSEAVRRDEQLPFGRYIDVITKDDGGDDIIRYYALGEKATWSGEKQFKQIDEGFASDEMEVYATDRSHCTDPNAGGDLLWMSKNWVSVISQVEKDGELLEPDETMKRMFELVYNQAEHWIIDLKVYKIGEEYFVRTMLNVNLWTPYELFWYDAEQDELVLLHTFDNQEIVGIRLHRGFVERDREQSQAPKAQEYGSFSPDRTESFDGKYYALQTVVDRMIEVTVYTTDGNRRIFSFRPARSMDFWGICWENDSYNIWTQSADSGIYCYEFEDGVWTVNPDAVCPSYIISRWDEKEE